MIIKHLGKTYQIFEDGTITETNYFGNTQVIARNWKGTDVVNQMVVNTLEELLTGEKSQQNKR